jgi:hypothetical protein
MGHALDIYTVLCPLPRADLEERRVAGTVAVADGEAAKTVAVADGEAAKTAVQWRRLCGVVGFWILLAIIAATVLGTAAAGEFGWLAVRPEGLIYLCMYLCMYVRSASVRLR